MPVTVTTPVNPPASETISTFNPLNLDSLLSYEPGEEKTKQVASPDSKLSVSKTEEKSAEGKTKHPAKILARGRSLGMTDAEMEDLDMYDLQDEFHLRQQTALAAANERAKHAVPKPTEPMPEPLNFGGANLEDVDDEIKKALTHLATENRNLKTALAAREKAMAEGAAQTVGQQLDTLFAANAEQFGKEPLSRLNPRSREMGRRSAIIGEMRRMHANGEKTTLDQDFRTACETLGYTIPEEPGGKPASRTDEEVERWAKAGLARPTARNPGKPPKGEKAAEDALNQALARNGFEFGGTVNLDSFPD